MMKHIYVVEILLSMYSNRAGLLIHKLRMYETFYTVFPPFIKRRVQNITYITENDLNAGIISLACQLCPKLLT